MLRNLNQLHRIPLAAFCGPAQGRKPLINQRRGGTLFWSQIAIPRAHRESIRLAKRFLAYHFDRHVQIFNHPLEQNKLLRVLPSEHRRVWMNNIEKLENDRGHAAKMNRTMNS